MTQPDAPKTYGPYDTSAELLDEPLLCEWRALDDSGPGHTARNLVLDHLMRACFDASVQLGHKDVRVLEWLARGEVETAQVVIGLISRAYAAGRAESETS